MTTLATPKSIIDPLSAFEAGAFTADSKLPVPLILTRFDISVDGGFVTVETKRVFRNVETRAIEATITFPVPVHAVLFELEARIDKRLLKAKAQKRTQARETYENAIDEGKLAILHEEVLRGIPIIALS